MSLCIRFVPPNVFLTSCPYGSRLGIPMAFGAGFKINNKDNSRSRHSLLPDPDEPPSRKSAEFDLALTADKTNEHHHHPPSSWSSILENWYSHPSPPPHTTSDPSQHPQNESQRVGPYELLIKERMMGLYLAIFVHREARPFVRGQLLFLHCDHLLTTRCRHV